MQKITIENFGPISNAEIALNELLIFIGPQASGKSIFSKLIYFFKSLRDDMIIMAWQTDEKNGLSEERFDREIKTKFVKFFGSTKNMPPFFIQCQYDENTFLTLTLNEGYVAIQKSSEFQDSFSRIVQSKREFDKKLVAPPSLNVSHPKFPSVSELRREGELKSASFKLLESEINTLFGEEAEPIFIPASRSLLATLSEQLTLLDKNNLDFLTEVFIILITKLKPNYSKSLDEIIKDWQELTTATINVEYLYLAKERITDILKGTYRFDKGEEKIFFNEQEFVKIRLTSSGQQESIWILLIIFELILNEAKVSALIIEEPEAHLYPIAQKQMVELMALFLNSNAHRQMIVTTHSPYILTAFNNLIYANEVANKKRQQVSTIIEPKLWIKKSKVNAFLVEENRVSSIMETDEEDFGLIKVEEIDRVSSSINQDFERLFELDD